MTYFNKYRLIILSCVCCLAAPAVKADILDDGRKAFLNYDFDLAEELYDKFRLSLKKRPNVEKEQLLERYERELQIAQNSLENVQKVEIIGRVDVNTNDFFKAVMIPAGAGKLLSIEKLPLGERSIDSDFVFSSESGDYLMWSETGTDEISRIMQCERLLDGSWEQPSVADETLNEAGNTINPFLLSDGVTLYFSGDGEDSMGGYDIFVATKDASSGEYRQPVGVGFPFNSPFNDYMMAIDEENGIGWWVTDRNQLDDKVSVYIFKTNDVRTNYSANENDNIEDLARVEDITITQNPNTDYQKLIQDIKKRFISDKSSGSEDFFFPMPGGKLVRSLSQFKSEEARKDMLFYLRTLEEHESDLKRLAEYRKAYHQTDKKKSSASAITNQIKDLEKKTEMQRTTLKKLRNNIIKAETK